MKERGGRCVKIVHFGCNMEMCWLGERKEARVLDSVKDAGWKGKGGAGVGSSGR